MRGNGLPILGEYWYWMWENEGILPRSHSSVKVGLFPCTDTRWRTYLLPSLPKIIRPCVFFRELAGCFFSGQWVWCVPEHDQGLMIDRAGYRKWGGAGGRTSMGVQCMVWKVQDYLGLWRKSLGYWSRQSLVLHLWHNAYCVLVQTVLFLVSVPWEWGCSKP